MNRLNVAAGIFIYLALQALVYGLDIAYRHGFDPTWQPHARYHVFISGIHIIAMAGMTVISALGGLRKARRSAWLTLAMVCTVGWAAWPLARAVAGEPPPLWVQLVTGGSFVLGLVALYISYGPCFAPREESSPVAVKTA